MYLPRIIAANRLLSFLYEMADSFEYMNSLSVSVFMTLANSHSFMRDNQTQYSLSNDTANSVAKLIAYLEMVLDKAGIPDMSSKRIAPFSRNSFLQGRAWHLPALFFVLIAPNISASFLEATCFYVAETMQVLWWCI
jgi:hypothetical protein